MMKDDSFLGLSALNICKRSGSPTPSEHSQAHTRPCCFHPLCTNPPPPVPPFLLTRDQSPEDIAKSDFTNC